MLLDSTLNLKHGQEVIFRLRFSDVRVEVFDSPLDLLKREIHTHAHTQDWEPF